MTWGAVAVGAGSIVMGSINANKAANAQKDIATIPTRSTGIEQLLRELTSTSDESTNSSERQNALEQLLSSEEFQEQIMNEVQRDQQMQESELGQSDTTQDSSQSQTGSTDSTAATDIDRTVTKGTAESQAAIESLISGEGGGQGRVDAIVNQILREGKTQISNVGSQSGSYGSTTEQLLTNDLITKAAEAGASEQSRQDQVKLQAIQAAQEGTTTEAGTQTTNESSQQLLEEIGRIIGSEQSLVDRTGTSSDTELTESTKEGSSEQQQERDTSTEIISETDKTTDTTSSDRQTGINDSYVDPSSNNRPVGGLYDLIRGGVAIDSEAPSTPAPVVPDTGARPPFNTVGVPNNLPVAPSQDYRPPDSVYLGGRPPATPQPVGAPVAQAASIDLFSNVNQDLDNVVTKL